MKHYLPSRSATFWLVLTGALGAIVAWHFGHSLTASWAYDDIDYINQAADALSGRIGWWETVFRPQGEHIVAGFRLVHFTSLAWFGVNAFPYRLFVLAVHLATALSLALFARRLGASRAGTAATAVAYVAFPGFSSMWLWFPSGASLPFALALFQLAWHALVSDGDGQALPSGYNRRRVLALGCVVLALLTESTLVPLVATPALLDEWGRRRRGEGGRLGWFAPACLGIGAGVAVVVTLVFRSVFGSRVSVDVWAGLPRACFLVAVAPFRYLFPGLSIGATTAGRSTALLGSVLGIAVGSLVLLAMVALWQRKLPRLVEVAVLTAVGPLGVLVLVGVGRWQSSYLELFDADRYFFTLHTPVALLLGALAASLAERMRTWRTWPRHLALAAVVAFLTAELALHRRAVERRIPYQVYEQHEARFAQLAKLVALLETAAAGLPAGAALTLPDDDLWFPDVHNGRISMRSLLYAVRRGGQAALELGRPGVGEDDAAVLDRVFDAWASEIGEPVPYVRIVEGRLANLRSVSWIDFAKGPLDEAVVSGIYAWEGDGRWLSSSSSVRLTMSCPLMDLTVSAPLGELQKASPERFAAGIEVRLAALDEGYAWRAELGRFVVESSGVSSFAVDATPFLRRVGNGRVARLELTATPTWRPGLILDTLDTRELSVKLHRLGCPP